VLEKKVSHVEVTVDDGEGERRIQDMLPGGRAPVEVIVLP
jgi:hypothetical protein